MSLTALATKTLGTSEQVKINQYNDGTKSFQRLLVTDGDTTDEDEVIANVGSTEGLFVGAPISGTGIPAGATVADFDEDSITLSAAATADGTNVVLTINKTVGGQPAAAAERRSSEMGDRDFLAALFVELLAVS